jgi:hypothetical protein
VLLIGIVRRSLVLEARSNPLPPGDPRQLSVRRRLDFPIPVLPRMYMRKIQVMFLAKPEPLPRGERKRNSWSRNPHENEFAEE